MINPATLQQLQQDIATIQATITSAGSPTNEAQTESLIIDPILKALGYATTDYVKQGFSSVGSNFPDYTILPNTAHKWVLEVKKFGHILKSADESQATGYGFHEATDWAVLTNGKTWYIYNIPLKSPSRRVLQIDNLFADKNAVSLLACLSHKGMTQDELTEAWNLKRVTELIEAEMIAPNSQLRGDLCEMVKKRLNLSVSDSAIGDVLAVLLSRQARSTSVAIAQPFGVSSAVPGAAAASTTLSFYTFGEILANPLLGTKQRPKSVDFGNGNVVTVSTWADAAKTVIEVLSNKYFLPPLPFTGASKGKNYFLNTTPTHSDGTKMRSHRMAQAGQTIIYIDTHRSVRDVSAYLVIFLKTINAPIDAAKVGI